MQRGSLVTHTLIIMLIHPLMKMMKVPTPLSGIVSGISSCICGLHVLSANPCQEEEDQENTVLSCCSRGAAHVQFPLQECHLLCHDLGVVRDLDLNSSRHIGFQRQGNTRSGPASCQAQVDPCRMCTAWLALDQFWPAAH